MGDKKIHCWELLDCAEPACPVFGEEQLECWLVPDTRCGGKSEPLLMAKLDACLRCPMFEINVKDQAMRGNIISFYTLLKGQESLPDCLDQELTLEFAEIYRMLSKLSVGDFSARLASSSGSGMIGTLKSLLNIVAGQMQEYVEETHELAIGICEHYETLNRLARNEFGALAAEDSPNELIAKLGILINKCTATLTSSIARLEQAEAETRNAYQQLLDIVEFLPDATFVIDRDGCVIAWNRALEVLTGVGKQEMLGKGDCEYAVPLYGFKRRLLIDYLEDATDRATQSLYSNVIRTHNTLSGETSITPRSRDNIRHVWVTATPLYDKCGNRAGGIESIRDVTELKRAEEEKTRLEAQLNHSKQMESLMLRLGHDLKTPLTPLFTLLPLIRERAGDPETKRMIDICCTNVRHIMDLSSKTMRLASLSTAPGEAAWEELDLAQAVKGVCREHAPMLEENRVRCKIGIPEGTIVLAVFDQLRELFSNLLANAIKASNAGATIWIHAIKRGPMVEITVADEGTGLTPENREIIFDEFFKVDEARQDMSTSGLGLSICKRIVLNHNGSIRAESSGLGHGTSIVFTLPHAAVSK